MSAPDGLAAFADPLGPRGRRRALIASVITGALLALLAWVVIAKFAREGQLDRDRWSELVSADARELYARGLLSTLKVAATAVLVSVTVGVVMALGRLSTYRLVRWLAGTYVELFRALPSLLLILFGYFGLPKVIGHSVTQYAAVVVGLSLYNSAVFAEIIRAGILSLPRGQAEAAHALGMRRGQAQRLVVLPQAVHRMLPTLVAQGVVVLKDTSYGFVIGYEELLRTGSNAGEVTGDVLQSYLIVAVIYLAVCMGLSRVARRLEGRTARRYGRARIAVAGTEELAVA